MSCSHAYVNFKFQPIKDGAILYIKATVVSVCVGSAWKILPVTAHSLWSLYIKANMVSVCVDKNWTVLRRFFQSLPVPCGASDKQGRAGVGQGGRATAVGGRARCHFY